MLSINTNTLNLTVQRNLLKSSNKIAETLQKLSTGLKINSAKDDSAGLYVGTQFSSQISGLDKASNNIQDGINMLKTADDALSTMSELSEELRALALQSANGTYSEANRAQIQQEAANIVAEMKRIEKTTTFDKKKVFEAPKQHKTLEEIEAEYADAKASGNLVLINSKEDLKAIDDSLLASDKVYVLMDDVDLSGENWNPIGSKNEFGNVFMGTLDGNGYTIDNMTIKGDAEGGFAGLIGVMQGTVKNLALTNIDVNVGYYCAGGLAGVMPNITGKVENCYLTGNVISEGYGVGGLAGMSSAGHVSNVCSEVNVKAGGDAGGLVGQAGCDIENSYSTGNVEGYVFVGGLLGTSTNNKITNSFSTGKVTGTVYTGGFIGSFNSSSSSLGNYWSSQLSGQTNATGNLAVLDESQLKNESSSFFDDSSNLSFLGDGYNYAYNPPRLSAFFPESIQTRIQVGANGGEDDAVYIDTSFALSNFSVDLSNSKSALNSLDKIDKLMAKINEKHSSLGSDENKLSSLLDAQSIKTDNYRASKSTMMDTDISSATSELTKAQILQSAETSLLAQTSNIQKNIILALF